MPLPVDPVLDAAGYFAVLAGRAPDVPKQRYTPVANGQQRLVAVASDLCQRLSLGGRTVLPKLAVWRVGPA